MCEWMEVSTSGFYEWADRPRSATARRRDRLGLLIAKAFEDSDGTYGYRRVHAQLARWGQACTPELVRALMRVLGLVACQPARPGRSPTWWSGTSPPRHRGRRWSVTLPTFPPGKAGSIWPPSSTATQRKSSGGPPATTTRLH